MQAYANPQRFVRLARRLTPWAFGAAIALALTGLYLGLFVAPPDYQQGEAMRIMYVHVPAAWLAMGVYASGNTRSPTSPPRPPRRSAPCSPPSRS
jgi:heme exporter protein C